MLIGAVSSIQQLCSRGGVHYGIVGSMEPLCSAAAMLVYGPRGSLIAHCPFQTCHLPLLSDETTSLTIIPRVVL